MISTRNVSASLGWFAAGLILTTGLVNLFGFVSPFYGHATGTGSRDLLHFGQAVTPWMSVCFVVGFWLLARSSGSIVAALVLRVLGIALGAAYVLPSLLSDPTHLAAAQFMRGVLQFTCLVCAALTMRALVSRSGSASP